MSDTDLYMSAKAWPFEQARQILKRLDIEKKRSIDRGDRPVVFETGYGPLWLAAYWNLWRGCPNDHGA